MSGLIGGNGILADKEICQTTAIYEGTKDLIKKRAVSAAVGASLVNTTAKEVQRAWGNALVKTTIRYTVGTFSAYRLKGKIMKIRDLVERQ